MKSAKNYIFMLITTMMINNTFQSICMELTPEMRHQIDKGKEKESSSSSFSSSHEEKDEQEQMEIAQGKEKDKPKKPGWVKRTKTAVRNVFSRKKQAESPTLTLSTLPEEIQLQIILQLTTNPKKKLMNIIKIIRSFAMANKRLNKLINDSIYGQAIITNLSKTFNVNSAIVASLLGTQYAQTYLINSLQFYANPRQDFNILRSRKIRINTQDKDGNSILMSTLINHSTDQSYEDVIKAIIENLTLNIDLQNNDGNTAMHILLQQYAQADESTKKTLRTIILIILSYYNPKVSIQNNDDITISTLYKLINDRRLRDIWQTGSMQRNRL